MWARAGAVAAGWLVAACFAPTPPAGVPCSEALTCPGDQVCDTTRSPPTCVDHPGEVPGDGGGGDPDTPPPVACGTNEDCPADAPTCDPDSHACRACGADADCASDACHELTGACIAEADAIYVLADGADNGMCDRAHPCATLAAGLDALSGTRTFVKVGDGAYTGNLQIRRMSSQAPQSAIVSGAHRDYMGGAVLTASGSVSVDQLTAVIEGITIAMAPMGVDIKGTATLSHVLIDHADNDGVRVEPSGALTMRDSRVASSEEVGIRVSGGTIDVQRSTIFDNDGGGIQVQGGGYTIINSVIARNGNLLTGTLGGAELGASPGKPAVFRFNTFVNNQSPSVPSGVICDGPATLEDSIFDDMVVFGTEVAGCSPRFCLFAAMGPSGNGNLTANPMFVAAPTDVHLMPGSPAIDKADPDATEAVDFEGGHRPTGAARDIGADEMP